MKDYSRDIKRMRVYTGDSFLEKMYGYKAVLVGQKTLVGEMWMPRNSYLEGLFKSNCAPSSMTVEFKLPEKILSGTYDISAIRTELIGVEDEIIQSRDSVYASKTLADRFRLDKRTIIIRPVIPKFNAEKLSPKFQDILR
jgi:hypothetical protein